jgi:hypothetical protein
MGIKLRSEIGSLPEVILAGNSSTIAEEIKNQLSSLQKFHVVDSLNQPLTLTPENSGIIIYFSGFGNSGLQQTLSSTEQLHHILQKARQSDSKLLLVIPGSYHYLIRTSILLLTQYSKIYRLKNEIIEIDVGLSQKDNAEAIIKKFYFRYKVPISPPARFLASAKPRFRLPQPKKTKTLLIFCRWFICLIFLFYIAILIQAVALNKFLSASETHFRQFRFSQSRDLASRSAILSRALDLETTVAPLSQNLLKYLGLSSGHSVLVCVNNYYSLLQALTAVDQFPLPEKLFDNLYHSLKQWQSGLPSSSQLISQLLQDVSLSAQLNQKFTYFSQISAPVKIALVLADPHYPSSVGGKITNLILFTYDSGKITDISTLSVSDLDRISPGSVSSSLEYQNLTGVSYWNFSDLNWNPDISLASSLMSTYITKALSIKPDYILFGLAPSADVVLDSFNNFNTGSVSVRNGLKFSFINSLTHRKLFIYPGSDSEWSGAIVSPDCLYQVSCFKSLFYYVGTSADTASHSPDFSRNITINGQFNGHQYLTSVIILSPDTHDKNYNYIYLPADAKITNLKIGDQDLFTGVDSFPTVSGVSKIGFNLPPVSGNLYLTYTQEFDPDEKLLPFRFTYLNQPGDFSGSVTVNINYPKTWAAATRTKPAVVSPGLLGYNSPISDSINLSIEFRPVSP